MSSSTSNAAVLQRAESNDNTNNNTDQNQRPAYGRNRRNSAQQRPTQNIRFQGSEPTLAGQIYDSTNAGNTDQFV
jgi:hypothetical protein